MNKTPSILRILPFLGSIFLVLLILGGGIVLTLSSGLPSAHTIKDIELKIPLRVYSSENLLIAEFGEERRKPIDIENVPDQLKMAILASEDDSFYDHPGIDIKGIIRAAISNFKSGGHKQGASTITMQVARNFFLTREKTYTRKIKEILLALKLEQILTKDEILSLYVNKIFLGHRAYGFGAAAEVYYGKKLPELSLAQYAMLAGLPKAPSTNNPITNPERGLNRRNYVLDRMHKLKWITDEQHQDALNQPVTASKHSKNIQLNAPYVAEMARAKLVELYGEEAYWKGFRIYTTINARKQLAAQRALRAGLHTYDQRHGYRGAVKKVELPDETTETAELVKHLSDLPNSNDLLPALVLKVEGETASALIKSGEIITIDYETAKWAKKYLSVNYLGPEPQSLNDALEPGDVVYITNPLEQDKWTLSQIPAVSGALVSLEPESGKIMSLVGGYDFFLSKYNRAIQSERQPGSNIKPFIYSAALEKGFTAASLISGAPIVIDDKSQGTIWRPENYSGKFFGPTRMRHALSKSMNLVSVRLLRAIGIPYTMEYLAKFGINTNKFPQSLSLALGAGTITPLEMLSAYSVIANGGYRVEPYIIERIESNLGDVVFQQKTPFFCIRNEKQDTEEEILESSEEPKPEASHEAQDWQLQAATEETEEEQEQQEDTCHLVEIASEPAPDGTESEFENIETEASLETNAEHVIIENAHNFYAAPQVIDPRNRFIMVSMLQEVIKSGTGRRALALEREDLAGKTGTTNDYVDAWFSGFNKDIATTVWVGFDEPQTLGRGEAGTRAALPIWVDYMRTALRDVPQSEYVIPEGVVSKFIDKNTGKEVASELELNSIEEYFIEDVEPTDPEELADLGILGEAEEGELNIFDRSLEAENPFEDPLEELPEDIPEEKDLNTDELF